MAPTPVAVRGTGSHPRLLMTSPVVSRPDDARRIGQLVILAVAGIDNEALSFKADCCGSIFNAASRLPLSLFSHPRDVLDVPLSVMFVIHIRFSCVTERPRRVESRHGSLALTFRSLSLVSASSICSQSGSRPVQIATTSLPLLRCRCPHLHTKRTRDGLTTDAEWSLYHRATVA